MAYFLISSFSSGLDLRRPSLVAPAGTLRILKNCHVTEGGDIEKRYAFVKIVDLPPDTFGIAGLGSNLYVFKQTVAAARAAPTPPPAVSQMNGTPDVHATLSVNVVNITMPAGKTASHLEDWDIFDDKLYAVIADTEGEYHHFYDGVIVDTSKAFVTARNIKTFKGKMYGIRGQVLVFSNIDDPTSWDPADTTDVGAGFIILGNIDGESGDLVGLEVYYDQLAVMSRYATQIWEVDPDPALNNLRQTLRNSGTISPRAVKQYGSGDVLYLHDSGIRSLRAKDSSNAAAVSDIGSPIDPLMRDIIKTRPNEQYIYDSFSLIEPNTGRFWFCFKDRIFILSYFPGPKVTAWSEYDPEMTLDGGVIAQGQVVLRSGDALFAYGGVSGSDYDDCPVEVETPFLDVDKPATSKMFTGIDLAAWADNGAWAIRAAYEINNATASDATANIYEPSFDEGAIGLEGVSTHISLRLKHEAQGSAMLSGMAVHYRAKAADKAN